MGAGQARSRPVTCEVVWRKTASAQFKGLDKAVQRRIRALVDRLAENPRPGQATQLVGDPKTWRVRAGDWRILYEIHDDQLRVITLEVGHRSEIY